MTTTRIALVGSPNCGKTALFNALTGARHKVANFAGVTVSCQEGLIKLPTGPATLIDLPGCYSLACQQDLALDQQICRQFLMKNPPDIIVQVIDATCLQRHLYLTSQLRQLGIPMLIALNMSDLAKRQGIKIDHQALSSSVGCPVVATVALKHQGMNTLKQSLSDTLKNPSQVPPSLTLPDTFPEGINWASHHPQQNSIIWGALENDHLSLQQLNQAEHNELTRIKQHTLKETEEDPDTWIADARFQWTKKINAAACQQTQKKTSFSQRADRIILNRWLGLPIFFAVMYALFVFAVNIGGAFQDFFDIGSDTLFIQAPALFMQHLHAPAWLIALICHGVGKGINTTITFMPVIAGMFLGLSILEDSGYMARAAFVVDRLMRQLGLPGHAFVPMIVGFGCNVPAVMGTRSLSHRRDRIITSLMMPFMSCGARLAIFAVFAAAFFPQGGQNVIFALYGLGIAAALFTGWLLRHSLLPGPAAPLIMEMPAYHRPHWRSLWRHTWQRLKHFVFRAGKVIVPVCMILGLLNHITVSGHLTEQPSQRSLLARTGQIITPVFTPMGIESDNWPATMGLLTGVLAKEVVVGTLNSLYAQAGHYQIATESAQTITQGLKAAWQTIPDNIAALPDAFHNPLMASAAPHAVDNRIYGMMHARFGTQAAAVAYLIFILLYFPCVSTMAAIKREIGSAWAYGSMLWNTVFAYGVATLYYQWFVHPGIHRPAILILIAASLLPMTITHLRKKNEAIIT